MAAVDARDATDFQKRAAMIIHRLLAAHTDIPIEVRKEAYEWLLDQVQRETATK